MTGIPTRTLSQDNKFDSSELFGKETMLTFGFIITILGVILCLVAFVDGWAETVIEKIEDVFSCEWDVNVVTMVIAIVGIILALTGMFVSAYIVLKRIRDSWWYARKEYRRRWTIFEKDRTEENLRSVYDYVYEYYKTHPDCLAAAYNIGWCTFQSWFVNPRKIAMFDDVYADNLLRWVYSKGDVDAAWLLGQWYGKIAAEAGVNNAESYEKWKERHFSWTKEFVDHNPKKTKRQKQEDIVARRDLAECYSNGYGTEENLELATKLFLEIQPKAKKDYLYVSRFADHLCKLKDRNAEKWYRKALKLVPGTSYKAECYYGIFKVGKEFGDFRLMENMLDQLKSTMLYAKTHDDDETIKYVQDIEQLARDIYQLEVDKRDFQAWKSQSQ